MRLPYTGQRQFRPAFRRDAIALLLFGLGALTLAWQVPQQYLLETRGVVLDGFHASEGSGSRRFRWTDGHAVAQFEGIGSRPYWLVLILSGPRPNGLPAPSARIVVNGLLLGSLTPNGAPQTYTFTIPGDRPAPAGSLDVQIDSDAFVPPNDLRTLGVAVSELRIEPLEGGFTWPAPLALGFGAVTVMAVFLSSGRRRLAWPAALLVLGVLVTSIASERVLAASLVPWAALGAATLYVGVRSKQRTTWAETAAALAVLLSLAHFVLTFLNLFVISRFTDVSTMFEAGQKLAQGLDPYDYGVIRDNPLYAHSYVYPPAFAQFLALLLPLGLQGAIVCWVALNFVLYFVALAGLLRLLRMRWRSAGTYAMLLVAFNYQPVIDTLYGGQLDILILALLVLSLRLALRGRLMSSGAVLAFAAITKLHPLLVLPFYFARNRLRGYLGFGLAFAVIIGVSLALSPPDLYVRYATVVLPGRGGGGTGNAENQSLSGFFYRADGLFWSDVPSGERERVLRLWTYGAGALLGSVTLGVVLITQSRSKVSADRRMQTCLYFSVFIVLMLLILPTAWMHYETQLLLPLGVLLAYALASRERTLALIWVLAACLTAFANWELFRGSDIDAWPLSLIQSYKLYGVLLVWGALLWAMIKEARAEKVGPG